MNRMYISAFAASNVGKRRQNNEDNYCINGKFVNSSNSICAYQYNVTEFAGSVCDGMGGEEAGEVASQMAVEAIAEYSAQLLQQNFSDESINQVVTAANDAICENMKMRKKRMGTTFTLLGVKDGQATVANVGDSRVYLLRHGEFVQISRDHTEAQSMVDAGLITAEASMKIPEKHRLTQHLGIFPYEMIIEPYIVRFPVNAGDRYLLCSDGLTDMLTDAEIKAILDQGQPLDKTVSQLVASALEHGGKDNVTVMLCEVSGNPITHVPGNIAQAAAPQQKAPRQAPPQASRKQASPQQAVPPQAPPYQKPTSKQEVEKAFGIPEGFNTPAPTVALETERSRARQENTGAAGGKSKVIIAVLLVICIALAIAVAFLIGKNISNKETTTAANQTSTTIKDKDKNSAENTNTTTTTESMAESPLLQTEVTEFKVTLGEDAETLEAPVAAIKTKFFSLKGINDIASKAFSKEKIEILNGKSIDAILYNPGENAGDTDQYQIIGYVITDENVTLDYNGYVFNVGSSLESVKPFASENTSEDGKTYYYKDDTDYKVIFVFDGTSGTIPTCKEIRVIGKGDYEGLDDFLDEED